MIHKGAEWVTPPGQAIDGDADPSSPRAYEIATPTEYSKVRLNQAVAARGVRRISRDELLAAARRGLEQIAPEGSDERRIYGDVLDELAGLGEAERGGDEAGVAAAELVERFAHFADVLRRHYPRFAELEAISVAYGQYHRLELVRLHLKAWRHVPTAEAPASMPLAIGGEASDAALDMIPAGDLRHLEVTLLARLILSAGDKKKSPPASSGGSIRRNSPTAKNGRRKTRPSQAKGGNSRGRK